MRKPSDLEIRTRGADYRVDDKFITGYAIVFDSLSEDLGGFREIIKPSAVTADVIEKSDVFALLDHNRDRGVLARSKFGHGTLALSVDERGLKFNFEAPNTALGDEVLESLSRGDLSQCSFAFNIVRDSDLWGEDKENGGHIRTITQINRLYDVSLVYEPAYEATDVAIGKRYLEAAIEQLAKEKIETEERLKKEAELRQRKLELEWKMFKLKYGR